MSNTFPQNYGYGMDTMRNTFNNALSGFSSGPQVSVSNSSFLDSNSIIAKIVFLILVIIVFVILLQIGLQIVGYIFSPNYNPMLIDGQNNGTQSVSIAQNPAMSSAKTIYRSNNQSSGLEFTWSVWLKYNVTSNPSKYQPVFIKGDAKVSSTSDFASLNNGPGVYFQKGDNNQNSLVILMDTVESNPAITNTNNQIVVPNIPIDKYFHLAVRCMNKFIDVYVNGTVVIRKDLGNTPKQNFYNVEVSPNGGFNGYLSNLQYFNRALSVIEINTIVASGPNTKAYTVASSGISNYSAGYISNLWYGTFL